MYILSTFSYPFDTKYNSKIISVSEEDLINLDLDFSIIGVNCNYNEGIESKIMRLGSHLSVDIKNKKFKFINKDENDIMKIENYISNYYQSLVDGTELLKKPKKSGFEFFDK
jgi:hypothetical protein